MRMMSALAAVAGMLMGGLPLLPSVTAAHDGGDERDRVARIVGREIQPLLPENGAGGVAVAVRSGGRTLFFSYGFADLATRRPVTEDSLFNLASLRKVFEATLLAEAMRQGAVGFDDPVTRYLPELRDGGDIRKVTVGQLAVHTSGILLPQDHPPWPSEHYTLAGFLDRLRTWTAEPGHAPGARHRYTHAGYVLLQLVLERALRKPIAALLGERIAGPLALTSTVLPERGADAAHGGLPDALKARAVQGYDAGGTPIGAPGDQQGYYDFPGTGQMFSTARDLATFMAASMGEASETDPALRAALRLAQRSRVAIAPHVGQALAWEVHTDAAPVIVGKNGGLNNTSTYIGLMPAPKRGVVILTNRGDQDAASAGRRILRALNALHS